jgi:hypothetical protein
MIFVKDSGAALLALAIDCLVGGLVSFLCAVFFALGGKMDRGEARWR